MRSNSFGYQASFYQLIFDGAFHLFCWKCAIQYFFSPFGAGAPTQPAPSENEQKGKEVIPLLRSTDGHGAQTVGFPSN